jgi:hypothetical protein
MKFRILLLITISASLLNAQDIPTLIRYFRQDIQFYRPNDQGGINVYETTKLDTTPFTGPKLRLGGNFTLDFQGMSHSNHADFVSSPTTPTVNNNRLVKLTNGFNAPMINLNLDVQLMDGMRVNMAMYLVSRFNEEFRVKNGYLQIDKMTYLKSALVDSIMKSITIRVGILEVDYGDQHYRRTDGGNSIYNPFVENYIMDQFTTEIGTEIYYRSKLGFIAMAGLTNGQLYPNVLAPTSIDSVTGKVNVLGPVIHAKIGYDKQLTEDLRLRFTGSVYSVGSTSNATIFSGDRTGSHYYYVVENTAATANGNAFSGRFNPVFSEEVHTFMVNAFVKYKGFEFFGTYEMAQGRTISEKHLRKATQYAIDVIYRFPDIKNFWIGVRYNSVTAATPYNPTDITINRIVGTVGTFVNKNIAMKLEYVNQQYQNFNRTDIRAGAKFDGIMFSTVVAF